MTRATWAWAAAAGCMLTAGVGCYSPAPYAPGYGYPSYQTMPGAYPATPPAGAYPGGSYVVPGGTMPGTLGPSNSMPGAGPTLAPPDGGNAPPATYAPGSTPPGNMVPNYDEPQPGDFDSGNGFGTPPDDGFKQPVPGGESGTGTPFYESRAPQTGGPALAERLPPRNDYLAGVDAYQQQNRPAVPSDLAANAGKVRPAGFQEDPRQPADFGFDPNASPAPATESEDTGFGYDQANYAWLRGVVDYDPQRKNWHIIYGLPPDPNDRFGGSLTLSDGGHLAEFRDSDVVMVQGRIDPLAGQDMLGKPLYRVSKAELIGRFE